MTLSNSVTSTDRADLYRWLEWSQRGDVVNTILAPQETHLLRQAHLDGVDLAALENLLNGADIARIHGFSGGLILMRQADFENLAGAA